MPVAQGYNQGGGRFRIRLIGLVGFLFEISIWLPEIDHTTLVRNTFHQNSRVTDSNCLVFGDGLHDNYSVLEKSTKIEAALRIVGSYLKL